LREEAAGGTSDEITRLSAAELGRKIQGRELSVREAVTAYLDRISRLNDPLNAYLTVCAERALEQADEAQKIVDEGAAGPLTGVPIALKDNLCTQAVRTTCASRILGDYAPPYDATAASRALAAGMPLLGKTNLDEFAMGTSTETGAFGPARNPWDLERSPGGSSGGSAAAVAAELAPLALGSDTGGSIRQPASLCGIVGFKPTYGRISRYGLIAFASSLDQVGPMARTVEDAALLASAVSGHDPRDSTSLQEPPIRIESLRSGSLRGLRLAMPKELWTDRNAPGVNEVCGRAVEALRKEGAEVREIELPSIAYGVTTYYILAPSEASSNLARYDGIRYGRREEGFGHVAVVEATRGKGFGHEVKQRIMIGTYALSAGYYDAYYLRAQQVRALMTREFESAFREADFIVSPSSPVTAFRIGELSEDPLALKLLDACTIPANMGGFPAISLPCGLEEGLPVGLQLIGPRLGDEDLLRAAWCVEKALCASCRPPLA
jgi:aspartyl-tRNA(Asn)/glutamyl-tRNA(Gln) amidotransferase subunit A